MVYKKLYTTNHIKKPICPFLEVNYNTLTCFLISSNKEVKSTVPYDLTSGISILNFISYD